MNQEETLRYSTVQDIILVPQGGPPRYPAHWHNAAEFILALRDGSRYQIQGRSYALEEGDLLLIWPRELHETLAVPDGAVFFIQFSDRLFESNLDLAAALSRLAALRYVSRREEPLLAERLASLMKAVKDSYYDDEPFRETRCKLLLYQMLLLIGAHTGKAKNCHCSVEDLSAENRIRMRAACAYIEAHYTEDIRQETVAEAVSLSICYFSRLFQKYTGRSFPQYLSRVRVQAAARLIGQTGLSVTECAGQSGFQSITTFNKRFLEEMGLSPRAYRKLYQRITG